MRFDGSQSRRAGVTLQRSGSQLLVSGPRMDNVIAEKLGARKLKHQPGTYSMPFVTSSLYRIRELIHDIEMGPGVEELDSEWGFPRIHLESTCHPKWGSLRGFQKQAVEYLISSRRTGSMLQLDPGLGKTPVSIIGAELLQAKRVLIVAPLSLLENWSREIERWGQIDSWSICHGAPPDGDWVITNYDTATSAVWGRNKDGTKKFEHSVHGYDRVMWDLVIVDESILVKNRDSDRFIVMNEICKRASKVWCLSGAPVSRFADDLWAQLHLLSGQVFSSFWRFAQRYCLIEPNPWSQWNIVGTNPGVDFVQEFRDFAFIRHQQEVMPELPEYIFENIDLALLPKQQDMYDRLINDFILELESGQEVRVDYMMARITRSLEIISNSVNAGGPDLSAKDQFIEEAIDAGMYQFPMLIWVHWREGAIRLLDRLQSKKLKVGLALGGQEDADELIESYKQGKLDILILGLGVGKYGHTLINTRTVIYKDRTFDMDAYYQSLHRVRRFGLDHRPVVVTPRHPRTVEELIEKNLTTKAFSIASISQADLAMMLKGLGGIA